MSNPLAPIGVFDSGVGGLTVARALMERLPEERFVYLGDTARVPYGNKSPETVARYSLNISNELIRRGCKAVVIACNTASAYAYEAVRDALSVPVFDVIGPVAHEVARSTSGTVAVLGTRGTVLSEAYVRAVRQHDPGRDIVQQACPLFVPLAEEGWTEGEVPRAVVRRYLEPIVEVVAPPRAYILGCTHYPLLSETIREVLQELEARQRSASPSDTGATAAPTLHESGAATAEFVAGFLQERGLLRPAGHGGRDEWLVTDDPGSFQTIAARFLGRAIDNVDHVDLGTLPQTSA